MPDVNDRTCPVCALPLQEVSMQHELVDRCTSCRGIFLDQGELDAILDMARLWTTVPLSEPDIDTVPQAEVDRVIHCPHDGAAMEPRDLAGTVVDECPTCSGIWLDGGEITALKLAQNNIRENLNLYIRLGQ